MGTMRETLMSTRQDIQVLCPWCSENMSVWFIDECDYQLPCIGTQETCIHCGNHVRIKGMTAPTIFVEKGRSKEQDQEAKLAAKVRWKRNVNALREHYMKTGSTPSLVCKFFGHTWKKLAASGYAGSQSPLDHKSFNICTKCLVVLDNLDEEPDDYGYFCYIIKNY
jgi:hypothetical protein